MNDDIIVNLQRVYQTLSLVSVHGEEDTQRMGGSLEMIRKIAAELAAVGKEGNDA